MERPPISPSSVRKKPYIPFRGKCSMDCPIGYAEAMGDNKQYVCKKCVGECKKFCNGNVVDSVGSAQLLRGCTHITDSLEIIIRKGTGEKIVAELELSLSSIEEIGGYLKILRSYPILSLSFFKKLKMIRGNQLDLNRNALILVDNENIQDLFDEGQNVTINGAIFAHLNPKLCYYKLKKYRDDLPPNSDFDNPTQVSVTSNGDKVACNVTEMKVRLNKVTVQAAIFQWDKIEYEDKRTHLGYMFHYKEAPSKNITMFDGRDACVVDG